MRVSKIDLSRLAATIEAIEAAANVYNEALETARALVTEIAEAHREYYDTRRKEWQESETGTEYAERLDAWECTSLDDLDAIEVTQQLQDLIDANPEPAQRTKKTPNPPAVSLSVRESIAAYAVACAVSDEQLDALAEFAMRFGAHWKEDLAVQWFRATAPASLHHLRNSHGPAWLATFDLGASLERRADRRAAIDFTPGASR